MSQMATHTAAITYKIPLAEFEKSLIADIGSVLGQAGHDISSGDNATEIDSTFRAWKWPELVRGCLNDDLGEGLQRYQGNKLAAYNDTLHFIAHRGGEQRNTARSGLLRAANSSFLAKLGDRPIADVEAVHAGEEDQEWRILSTIYHITPPTWQFEDFLESTSTKFEVWELLRAFAIQWLHPDNAVQIRRALFNHPIFTKNYSVEENDEISHEEVNPRAEFIMHEANTLKIKTRPDPSSISKWPEDEPTVDDSGKPTDEYLSYQIRLLGKIRHIQDPRSFLHFIPWQELRHPDEDTLTTSDVDLSDPFSGPVSVSVVSLWNPRYSGFTWNHHLHTEDEVFGYSIREAWQLPDHAIDDNVIFIRTPIEDTMFIQELGEFWRKWNDCAITQESSNSPLILLQTLPGIRFRSRWNHQDEKSALSYFRNLVELHAVNGLRQHSVRDAIGLEAGYTPRFEHSLRIIPAEQLDLDKVDWEHPLGKGDNGAVYAATWKRPPGILSMTWSGEMKVVLKEVRTRAGESRAVLRKFMKELDATYASLGGNAVGCTEFLGITFRIRSDSNVPADQPAHQGAVKSVDRQLYLVFERASRGTARECLVEEVKDASFIKSWDVTANALNSICNGLVTLHEHGVVHRDLHPNNILVTEKFFDDPEYPIELQFMISDIGEGKVLRPEAEKADPTGHRASYGAVDYRAPEIERGEPYTPSSDVFSYGVIACRIMDCRRAACKAPPQEEVLADVEKRLPEFKRDTEHIAYIVPKLLKKEIEPCLAGNPEARPKMRPVALGLDDCTMQFFSDKVQWTYWNWDESLAEARKGVQKRDRVEGSRQMISGRTTPSAGAESTVDDDLVVSRLENIDWESD